MVLVAEAAAPEVDPHVNGHVEREGDKDKDGHDPGRSRVRRVRRPGVAGAVGQEGGVDAAEGKLVDGGEVEGEDDVEDDEEVGGKVVGDAEDAAAAGAAGVEVAEDDDLVRVEEAVEQEEGGEGGLEDEWGVSVSQCFNKCTYRWLG